MLGLRGVLLLVALAAAQAVLWGGAAWLVFVRTVPFPGAAMALGLWRWPGPLIFGGLVIGKGLALSAFFLWQSGGQDEMQTPLILLFSALEIAFFVAAALVIHLAQRLKRQPPAA